MLYYVECKRSICDFFNQVGENKHIAILIRITDWKKCVEVKAEVGVSSSP